MKNIVKINDNLSVKEDKRKNRTIISVIDDDKELYCCLFKRLYGKSNTT